MAAMAMGMGMSFAEADEASSPGVQETPVAQDQIHQMAEVALRCAHQPVVVSHTGQKSYGLVQSHCEELKVEGDRAEIRVDGHVHTVLVRDNEMADEGDLNDLYVRYDSREDREALVGQTLLSFGDPVLALLITAGQSPEQLPEMPVEALSR